MCFFFFAKLFKGKGSEIKESILGRFEGDTKDKGKEAEAKHAGFTQADLHSCLLGIATDKKKNQEEEEEEEKEWLAKVTHKLAVNKFLVKLNFQFREATRTALKEHQDLIRIHNTSASSKQLDALMQFDGCQLLKDHRDKIVDLFSRKVDNTNNNNSNSRIKVAITKVEFSNAIMLSKASKDNEQQQLTKEQEEEADLYFNWLKDYLESSQSGVAVDAMHAIGMPRQQLNLDEAREVNRVIAELFNLSHPFDLQSIKLEPASGLVDLLLERNALKHTMLHVHYTNAESNTERLQKKIEKLAEEIVTKDIESSVENDSFVSKEELQTEKDSMIKKLKEGVSLSNLVDTELYSFIWSDLKQGGTKPEEETGTTPHEQLVAIFERDDFTARFKNWLVEKKKKEQLEKLPEQMCKLVMETMGALKEHAKCTIGTTKLVDFFKGGSKLPVEVAGYVELKRDMVISFSKYLSPWNWKTFAVAAFGIIQVSRVISYIHIRVMTEQNKY